MVIIDKILEQFGYVNVKSWSTLWSSARESSLFGDISQTNAYKKDLSVYKGIKAITDNAPQAELVFKDWNTDKQIYPQEWIKLFERPNPLMTYNQFIKSVVGCIGLDGGVFILKTGVGMERLKSPTTIPKELWVFRIKDGEVIVEDGIFKGYQIRNKRYQPWEVAYPRDFNPDNLFGVVSGLEAGKQLLEMDYEAQRHNVNFFKNGGTPGIVIETDNALTKEQRKAVKEQLDAKMKGSRKSFVSLVLEKGLKLKAFTPSHKEMDFIEQLRYTREEILGIWRVPKALLNITDDLNYACIVEGERIYTINGPKKVETVTSGDYVFVLSENGQEIRPVVNSWRQGVKESYSLKTSHREIKTSYDHPILCLEYRTEQLDTHPHKRNVGELVWKKMEDIERGDFIVVADNCEVERDVEYTEGFAELCGALLADGYVDVKNGKVSIATHSMFPELRERYARIAKEEFRYKKPGMENREYSASLTKTTMFLSGNAFDRFKEAGCFDEHGNKKVPEWIWQAPYSIKIAFLRGYADGDGSLQKRGNLVFAGNDEEIIKDIAALCDYLGIGRTNVSEEIRSSNFKKEYKTYRFSVQNPQEIGLIKNSDRIKPKYTNKKPYEALLGKALDVLPEGFHVERVKSKRNIGEKVVYDLEIEGRHNFLCYGVVVHNTFIGQIKAFWQYGLMPLLRMIEDSINYEIIRPVTSKIYCEFDISNVPAFREDFKEQVQVAKELFAMGFTANEINEKFGWGFEPKPWRDNWWIPMSQVPAGEFSLQVGNNANEGGKSVHKKEVSDDWAERKAIIHKAFLMRHTPIEKAWAKKLSRFFYEQRQEILAQLNEKGIKGIEDNIDWEEQDKKLMKYSIDFIEQGVEGGIKFGLGIIGADIPEGLKDRAKILVASIAQQVTRVNQTVKRQLQRELLEGIQEGETTTQLADRVRNVYNMASNRSMTIARTETTRAMNGGADIYYEAVGVEKKQWLTAGDEAVRDSHQAVDGEIRERGQMFSNGLMFPGDPNGSAEETINCRCVLLGVI